MLIDLVILITAGGYTDLPELHGPTGSKRHELQRAEHHVRFYRNSSYVRDKPGHYRRIDRRDLRRSSEEKKKKRKIVSDSQRFALSITRVHTMNSSLLCHESLIYIYRCPLYIIEPGVKRY